MATPPTRILFSTPAVGYLSTAAPKTTPTFDVTINDLVVCVASSENELVLLSTPTTTGNITWTLQQSIVVTNYCSMYVWTGVVNATATGITVSVTRSSGVDMFGFGLSVWRSHGGVGTSTKTNVLSGAPSLAITCSANSAVVCGSDDWTSTDGTTRTWLTVNGSPMTESLYARNTINYAVYQGYSPNVGAAGSVTVGLSAPGAQKYSILVVEVLGVAAAAYPFGTTTLTPRYRTLG